MRFVNSSNPVRFRCPMCGSARMEFEVFAVVICNQERVELAGQDFKYYDDTRCRCTNCNRISTVKDFIVGNDVELANIGDAASRE